MIDLIEIDNLAKIEFEMREIYWNYKSFSADDVARLPSRWNPFFIILIPLSATFSSTFVINRVFFLRN